MRCESDPLLEALSDVLDQVDGPPHAVIDRAAALFVLRDLDSELLVLLSDTRSDAPALVTRVDELDWRLVVFQGASCTIRLEMSPEPREMVLLGQITPGGAHHVELQLRDVVPAPTFRTDEFGRFRTTCPEGSFRVLVTLDDGRRILTPSVQA